jgi:hypothetical protein
MDHHERLNCIVNLLRIPVAGAMETTRTGYDKAAGSSPANIVSLVPRDQSEARTIPVGHHAPWVEELCVLASGRADGWRSETMGLSDALRSMLQLQQQRRRHSRPPYVRVPSSPAPPQSIHYIDGFIRMQHCS